MSFSFTRMNLSLGLLLVIAAAHPAAGQDDRPEGFAAHFHRDDTTVLVVEDPLPHLRTVLNSNALRKVLHNEGPLARLLQGDEGLAPDPAAWWQWVNSNRRWIPRQAAVGLSDAGVSDVDHLLRILALFELLEAANLGDANDVKLQTERKALRQLFADELAALRLPRMRVYVRFRDAEDAGALLELAKLQVDDLTPEDLPSGLVFEPKASALTVRFSLVDMLRAEGLQARDLLVDMGLVDLNDPPETVGKAVDALRGFKAEATLETVGSGLLLTLGPTAAGGPAGLPAGFANLPDVVGKPDAQTLLWGRWSAIRLKAAAATWMSMHEKWRPSAAFGLVAEDPSIGEATIDMLHDVAMRFRKLADAGSMRVWFDQKASGLRLAMVEEPKAATADLAGSALAKMLPADTEGLTVTTADSLGEALSDTLMQVEERLATQTLRAEVRGNDNGQAEERELGYYFHFAELRALVHRAGMEQFGPGYASIIGTRGRVRRIEASFELQTRPQRLSGRDLPTPELALIGKPRGGDAAAREHLEKLYSALLTGVRSAGRADALSDRPLPPVISKAVTVDLGLGVPTWGFDGGNITRATGEAKLRISIEGDLQPHFFFLDGLMVFSTSPRLSRSILATHAGKSKRLMLPDDDDATLVSLGRYTGETLGTTLEHVKAWSTAMMASANLDQDDQSRLATVMEAMAAVSRIMGSAEWTTIQPANERRHITEGVIFASE